MCWDSHTLIAYIVGTNLKLNLKCISTATDGSKNIRFGAKSLGRKKFKKLSPSQEIETMRRFFFAVCKIFDTTDAVNLNATNASAVRASHMTWAVQWVGPQGPGKVYHDPLGTVISHTIPVSILSKSI